MFPTHQDIEAFQAEFGPGSVLDRQQIPQREFCGTQAAAVILPLQTKEETLKQAWSLVRRMASWIIDRAGEHPASERYVLIVGWSQSVRRLQGQIFKIGGDREVIRSVAGQVDWSQSAHAPLARWEKDVFQGPVS